MAKNAKNGNVNRSQAIRELLKEKPEIKAGEAIATLSAKGIPIKAGLFYLVKGKAAGEKGRRKKVRKNAMSVATASGNTDALATILKVKKLAAELGSLHTLKALVDALSE